LGDRNLFYVVKSVKWFFRGEIFGGVRVPLPFGERIKSKIPLQAGVRGIKFYYNFSPPLRFHSIELSTGWFILSKESMIFSPLGERECMRG
jgi:hypothetical protein